MSERTETEEQIEGMGGDIDRVGVEEKQKMRAVKGEEEN